MILSKKNKAGSIKLPDIKIYYKVTELKWHDIGIKVWDTIETLKVNPHTYNQLIFEKDAKNMN